jgi:hypothetical protein
MKLSKNIKIILLIPVLIAGSFAIMILSYLLVPMMIVGVAYFISKIINDSIELQEQNRCKYSRGKK